jgi:hypothetical protein
MANLKKILSGTRHDQSWALALSIPIKMNPIRPEMTSQPRVRVQIGFKFSRCHRLIA